MGPRTWKRPAAIVVSAVAAGALALAGCASGGTGQTALTAAETSARTATPIKHVVVLFDENESFDHYFGTYPNAANTDGSTFKAKKGTPKVNGLTPALLTS